MKNIFLPTILLLSTLLSLLSIPLPGQDKPTSPQAKEEDDNAPKESTVDEVWSELKKKYGIEKHDGYVMSHDGKKYSKRSMSSFEQIFNSDSLEKPFGKPFFPEFTSFLSKAFDEAFDNLKIDSSLKSELQNLIAQRWVLLGSKKIHAFDSFKKEPLFHKLSLNNPKFEKAAKIFFGRVENFNKKYVRNRSPKKVMIVSSSGGGGGHLTPALAFKNYIEAAHPNLEVTLVDTVKLKTEQDVFFKFSGKLHGENIYDEIRQKEGNTPKFVAYLAIRNELREYLPEETTKNLHQAVEQYKPDVIFSFTDLFFDLGYFFDVPFVYVETNYSDPGAQLLLDGRLVKIAVPSVDPEMFDNFDNTIPESLADKRKLFAAFKNGKIDWAAFNKEFDILWSFGFPVRDGIEPITDINKLKGIRNHFKARADSKIVSVVMGKNGTSLLRGIVQDLINSESKFASKVDVFVATGANTQIKREIDTLVGGLKGDNLRIISLEMLSAKQISELLNASEFVVSKPGGSTTAEVAAIGVPLIAPQFLPWEEGNLKYLERRGLGYRIDLNHISQEILSFVTRDIRSKVTHHPVLNWKDNFQKLCKDWLNTKASL